MRYKKRHQADSILISYPIAAKSAPLEQAKIPNLQLLLRIMHSNEKMGLCNGTVQWNDILSLAKANIGKDEFGLRQEFVKLVDIAKSLSNTK